jgi:hypothetical protein
MPKWLRHHLTEAPNRLLGSQTGSDKGLDKNELLICSYSFDTRRFCQKFRKTGDFFRCCLKEHRKFEEQNTKIQNLEQSLAELKKTVQELAEKK